MRQTLVLLCVVLLPDILAAQNLTDAKTLYENLFTGYKKQIMPRINFSEPLSIGVIFYLASFNSFQEVDETLSVTVALSLQWIDPSMVWDPLLYGGLQSLVINPEDLWIPPAFLINGVSELEPIGDDTKFYTTIYFTGEINYTPGGILDAKCPTDISKFPFDTQDCNLQIIPWGISSTYGKFYSVYHKIQMEYFTSHSDWTITDHSTYAVDFNDFAGVWANLKIKRKPLYYAVMIILPTLLFSILNPLVFVLPVESGERVSLAMTILLSYAIFLTLVSASIPTSSNPMCVLLVVMIVIIAISGLIVVGAIVSVKYHYQDDDMEIGSTFRYLVSVKRRLRRKNLVTSSKTIPDSLMTGKDVSSMLDSLLFISTYVMITVTIVSYFIYVLV